MITSKDTVNAIKSFRTICFNKYDNDIDPITPEIRDERLGLNITEDLYDLMFFELSNKPVMQITKLLKTPRQLKMILRRAYNSWEVLHGEIDLDDVIVASVLRLGAPESYDFIMEHFREIRGLAIKNMSRDVTERQTFLYEKWEKSTGKVSWDRGAAEELLIFLFPSWKEKDTFTSDRVAQGVRLAEPTDYWIRLNQEDLSEIKILDQKVLQAISGYKKNKDQEHFNNMRLPQALLKNDELVEKFEAFAKIFLDGNETRMLASELFSKILQNEETSATGNDCAAFLSLWRLSLDHPIEESDHYSWLLEEIKKALTTSLEFTNDLYYYFHSTDRSDLSYNVPCPDLREPFINEVRKVLENNPTKLISILDSKYNYTIYHLVVHYSYPRQGGSGFKAEEWPWLIKVLIEAAKIEPNLILPQIVMLLFEPESAYPDTNYKFDSDLAESLFGDDIQIVMELICEDWEYEQLELKEKNTISFSKSYAKDWLANKK